MATSIDIDAPNPPWTDALLDLKRGKQVILERNGVPVAQLAEAAPEPTVRAPDRGYGMDAGKIWFAPISMRRRIGWCPLSKAKRLRFPNESPVGHPRIPLVLR